MTLLLLPAMALIAVTTPAMAEVRVVCPPHAGDFPNEPVIEDTDTGKMSRVHNQQARAIAVRACAQCGDSIPEPGEQCDTGGESAGCDADCTFAICGDGVLNTTAGEECDDGNKQSGDDCSATCTNEGTPVCGDGTINNPEEECDDGDNNDNDACTNSCTNARCGDGSVWNDEGGTEFCDEGGVFTVSCDSDCTAPACGDGVVNTAAGEECEPEPGGTDTLCDSNCTATFGTCFSSPGECDLISDCLECRGGGGQQLCQPKPIGTVCGSGLAICDGNGECIGPQ